MVKIVGQLAGITTKTCRIEIFQKEEMEKGVGINYYWTALENLSLFFGPTLTLKYDKKIVDSLIEHIDYICEVSIKDGVIVGVKPVKKFLELLEELKEELKAKETEIDIDLIMTGKPKSLQNRLQRVLSVLAEMEQATGIVRDEDLYQRLEEDYNISRDEAKRLIRILLRDGTIYTTRPGHFKKV